MNNKILTVIFSSLLLVRNYNSVENDRLRFADFA